MVERPSEILGKYQVGDTIGHGAFGKVFRGLNVQSGDFIAIKQIEKAVIQPEHLPGILRECEALRNLNHPNIVTFIDSYETDEFLYYIMEYVEAGSISKLVKKFGTFPESLLAYYISQVLKGLHYLHSQGVIHRDIKGENVLVTTQGTVKLVDFGSCTYQAMDKMLTVVGTPFWMAPEIIEMDGSARNTACDIWSLGCTIIELCTGFPPFWELGPMPAMFAMVNHEHPPLPTGISESLREFLLLCFTKEIHKRPTAAQLLEHPWISVSLKKKIDFNLNSIPNPERDDREAKIKQLHMENENLRSTVKSLKQHMLKSLKDQKTMRARIESLETELAATKTKLAGSPTDTSPESHRKPPGNSATNGTTYLSVAAAVPGANISAERLVSSGRLRPTSGQTKPLPATPAVVNGASKNAPKAGQTLISSDTIFPGGARIPSPQHATMRDSTEYMTSGMRSRTFSEPSPYLPNGTELVSSRGTQALQTGSVSSPRPIRNRCGTCAGCLDEGVCHYLVANMVLSPSLHRNSPPAAGKAGYALTHPASPHTPHRASISPQGFAYQYQKNIQATASTPNLPIHLLHDPTGRASPPTLLPPQTFSPPSVPAATIFSPSTSPPQIFSPPVQGSMTLKPGDKCRVRSNSNTWHRAIIDELADYKKSAVVVYTATGKKEEVLLDNILTEEEGKRKKREKQKEKGQDPNAKRKHVATIFSKNV